MKKILLLHPFLFGIYPILFLYSQNASEVVFSDTYFLFFASISSVFFLLFLNYLLFKNLFKASILTSVILMLFYFYGVFYDTIEHYPVLGFNFARHALLFAIWVLIFFLVAFFLFKRKEPLDKISKILNVVGMTLVLITLFNLSVYLWNTKDIKEVGILIKENHKIAASIKTEERPDIYYIILDGYANHETLKSLYNYDNSDVLNYLRENKFKVVEKGRTNHAITFLSLSSSLNMDYDTMLTRKIGINVSDRNVPYQMIKNNRVVKFLTTNGYQYIHMRSGWLSTNKSAYATQNISTSKLNDFEFKLIQMTVLYPFTEYIIGLVYSNRIVETFNTLAEDVPLIPGPKFVFAHILLPHPPFFFKPNGERNKGVKIDFITARWEDKDKYLDQLKYANSRIKIMVDGILANSKKDPIIIIQSDHGPGHTFQNYDSIGGWESPTLINLNEKMRILNAYHLPGNADQIIYDSITPVNTFRTIFNHYFKTDFPLHGDHCYYSYMQRPYDFKDVTSKIKFEK